MGRSAYFAALGNGGGAKAGPTRAADPARAQTRARGGTIRIVVLPVFARWSTPRGKAASTVAEGAGPDPTA
jgi:hypothetical protein